MVWPCIQRSGHGYYHPSRNSTWRKIITLQYQSIEYNQSNSVQRYKQMDSCTVPIGQLAPLVAKSVPSTLLIVFFPQRPSLPDHLLAARSITMESTWYCYGSRCQLDQRYSTLIYLVTLASTCSPEYLSIILPLVIKSQAIQPSQPVPLTLLFNVFPLV